VGFETKHLPSSRDAVAPDGSDVRILLRLEAGSLAHFELGPGLVSKAVTHRTVEEIWYFLAGRGRMWRKQGQQEETVEVYPGVSITIPLGTHFQFRCDSSTPLEAVGITMPPWPGKGEAVPVTGTW
jgi:mannose-6-phosphate isomerase-like protein (cupin superfamily)